MPPVGVATASLAQDQVESFATVVGDDPYVVAQVLASHPDLVPVATAAANARAERKRTGSTFIALGFSVLGVGLAGGSFAALSAPLLCFDEECRQKQDRASSAAEAIMIGGAVIGALLAIPGFVKRVREGDTELEAIQRYRNVRYRTTQPLEPARLPAMGSAPRSVNLSVLSMTF